MGVTRNHGKSAERKKAEIKELEFQMSKGFLCGACHVGFPTKTVGQALHKSRCHLEITPVYLAGFRGAQHERRTQLPDHEEGEVPGAGPGLLCCLLQCYTD